MSVFKNIGCTDMKQPIRQYNNAVIDLSKIVIERVFVILRNPSFSHKSSRPRFVYMRAFHIKFNIYKYKKYDIKIKHILFIIETHIRRVFMVNPIPYKGRLIWMRNRYVSVSF